MAVEFGQRLTHGDIENVPQNWLKFRKYDGHSAIWLPSTQDLSAGISGLWSLGRSSGPKPIAVPKVWLYGLPMDMALHGELWADDDRPQTVSSALKKSPSIMDWKRLKLVVFAFPKDDWFDPNDETTWSNIENDTYWYDARRKLECLDLPQDGRRILLPTPTNESVVPLDWEGMVFQNPNAQYRIGRSKDVQKFKPYYDDEATVVGYEDGKTGARIGTTGALIVDYIRREKILSIHGCPSDLVIGSTVRFKVSGLNESEWNDAETAYPIGSEVKFKFLSLSNKGTPMHCSVFREE